MLSQNNLAPNFLTVEGVLLVLLPNYSVKKLGKKIYRSNIQLLLSFTVILDVYRPIIPNKTTFTKHCLTQWISKLLRSFKIHWVRQWLVNFCGLVGIVNATVYNTKPISGRANCPNFLTAQLYNSDISNQSSYSTALFMSAPYPS